MPVKGMRYGEAEGCRDAKRYGEAEVKGGA